MSSTSSSTSEIYSGKISSPSDELRPISFSSHVNQALQELLQSDDIFDSPYFKPVYYLNQIFPNEQSIHDNLETFMMKVKRKVVRVDEEILTAVRRQSTSGAQATRDLEEAKSVIHNLFAKIQDIKSKAEQSEVMVQKITRDIKELDHGKKHLTSSVKAMGQLRELVLTLSKLDIKQRNYREIAEAMKTITKHTTAFEKYKDIYKVNVVLNNVKDLKYELKDQILKDFQGWERHEESNESVTKMLSEACLALDVLGDDTKQQLITQFTKQQISLYKMIFSQKKKSSLDQVSKRYNWMRKLLQKYEQQFSDVFPDEWCVRQELAVEFCLATREDIVKYLNANKGAIDPTVLYRSILNTTTFERDMHERFHVQTEAEFQKESTQSQLQVKEELAEISEEKTSDAIKKKFKLKLRQRELERKAQQQRILEDVTRTKPQKKSTLPQKSYKFLGFISSCFDDHMDTYVNFEASSLQDALEGFCEKETWTEDGETRSHEDLFMYISASIKSCTAFSKGKVLMNLIEKVWKKYLRAYASFVSDSLPRITTQNVVQNNKDSFMDKMDMRKWITNEAAATSPDSKQQQGTTKFTESEENTACYIIHVATFCQSNIEIMQEDLRSTMEEPYSSQVDLSDEMSKFYIILKTAVEQLVLNLMSTVENELKIISLLPLGVQTEVGDQSDYVTNIVGFLNDAFPYLADKIPANHYKSLCENFVRSVFHSYTTHIFKCKKVNATGAQQLLLDVTSIADFLKTVLNIGDPNRFDEDELHPFAKKVHERSVKMEMTLKVLGVPTEVVADTYRGLIPDGNIQDFNLILDLMGLNKNEKTMVLEQYNKDKKAAAANTNLVGKTMEETAKFMEKMKTTFTF
jgi:hypothetical protein